MPGILDMFNAQPNTGSNSTPQNAAQPSLMQLMQGMLGAKQPNAPPYGDAGFNSLPFQSSPEQLARMLQLQSLMGVKQPPNSGEQLENPNFNNAPFVPSQEQAARMAQLTSTFPQSRNVIDVRQTPQFYPQQLLPIQGMMQGAMQGMQANQSWPRPNPGPMMRYPNQ